MKQYFFAVATLVGTVVGAGIFGIPYVISRAGIISGLFYLLVIGAIVLLIKWLYGEVILRTKGDHRLVGYAEKYLGKKGKWMASFSSVFGFYGSLLAYLILGGRFLYVLLGPYFNQQEVFFVMVFFVLGSVAVFVSLKMISATEFFMSLLLMLTVFILVWQGLPKISFDNFFLFDYRYLFLAYSVIFYSLLGSSALPEMRQILKSREEKFRSAIFWGLAIPVIIYILFSFSIIGVSGDKTSQDAISGLIPFLGGGIIKLGAVFGFLAVFSSFIMVGLGLKKVLNVDFGINKNLSWLLVVSVPLLLFLAGLHNFVLVIGVIGIVMGGIEGVLMILIYKKADWSGDREPEYDIYVPQFVLWALASIFIFGMAYQLWSI